MEKPLHGFPILLLVSFSPAEGNIARAAALSSLGTGTSNQNCLGLENGIPYQDGKPCTPPSRLFPVIMVDLLPLFQHLKAVYSTLMTAHFAWSPLRRAAQNKRRASQSGRGFGSIEPDTRESVHNRKLSLNGSMIHSK